MTVAQKTHCNRSLHRFTWFFGDNQSSNKLIKKYLKKKGGGGGRKQNKNTISEIECSTFIYWSLAREPHNLQQWIVGQVPLVNEPLQKIGLVVLVCIISTRHQGTPISMSRPLALSGGLDSDRNPICHCFIHPFSGKSQSVPSTVSGTPLVIILYIHSLEKPEFTIDSEWNPTCHCFIYPYFGGSQSLLSTVTGTPLVFFFYTSIFRRNPEIIIDSDWNPTCLCGIHPFSGGSHSLPSTMSGIPLVIFFIHPFFGGSQSLLSTMTIDSDWNPTCHFFYVSIFRRKP